MMTQDTVLVRHLPSSLSHQEKSELLQHFGAVDVKVLGPESKKTNLVFARFHNSKAAEVAVQKLHQLDVFGHKISAEIARGKCASAAEPVEASVVNISDEKQDRILKAREAFLKKLGLSIKNYDFSQPPPLNICYQYPPPSQLVLSNICKAMACTPNFYKQVLHLMNKMNLPCPFTDKYPLKSDLFREMETNHPEPKSEVPIEESVTNESVCESENESEIGSDSEQHSSEIIPLKRQKLDKKLVKRPKFLKPQTPAVQVSKVGFKPDDVFENTHKEQVSKKIELKISADLSSIQVAQEIQAEENLQEGFEVIRAPQKSQAKEIESGNSKDESNAEDLDSAFISAEELAANRVSTKDQKVLPVFKNYQAGAPSCRLYIKNLAKQVQTRDLHFIYRRYYRPDLDQEQGSMFDVRLMQEGRMKGQAFITLQTVAQAQTALRETNGFILKDKPMVVQFARSAAAK